MLDEQPLGRNGGARLPPRRGSAPLAAVVARITWASGTEGNPLARRLGERVAARASAEGRTEHDFRALRASLAVVATDRQLATTLRFDHGVLTIHDGILGLPDITLCGTTADLRALAELGPARSARRSAEPAAPGAWRRAGLALGSGELRIYGLWTHPRLALRLWRLLRRRA